MRTLIASAYISLVVAGCLPQSHSARLLTADAPVPVSVTSLAPPLTPGENIRPTELRRGESSSLALVQVRDREQPHVHTRYDLTVVLVRGEGTLWLNNTPLEMREGDVAFIPKGTPHYFINEGSEPATAFVVFAPPFSGPDQQPQ